LKRKILKRFPTSFLSIPEISTSKAEFSEDISIHFTVTNFWKIWKRAQKSGYICTEVLKRRKSLENWKNLRKGKLWRFWREFTWAIGQKELLKDMLILFSKIQSKTFLLL